MAHGPAVPAYVLRGHEAPVHALTFYADNLFLASGDSEGWLVIWSLSSKRPVAVWKAHEAGVLQIEAWTSHRLVRYVSMLTVVSKGFCTDTLCLSHGRDHKFRVWQLRPDEFTGLSTTLPAETGGSAPDQPQPWLLHSFSIGALNFCAFSTCNDHDKENSTGEAKPQLIATPNGLDSGGIDIFQLPSEKRISQIKSDKESPTGMVMAVSLIYQEDNSSTRLVLVSGYEDGRVIVHVHQGNLSDPSVASRWLRVMSSKPHTQPVLSLEILSSQTHFLTSSADATIAKYKLPDVSAESLLETQPEKSINTKHAGQQSLSVRSDDRIFATAGWDGRVRVYSCKTLKEVAVLKWHPVGVYSTALATITDDKNDTTRGEESQKPEESSSTPTSLSTSTGVTKRMNTLDLIKEQREAKARRTHWLAAGGKDGKISLWDIY